MVRTLLSEQVIDGEKMNSGTESLCNTMSVGSYDEVIGRLIHAIGREEDNPEMWAKIQKPLSMLKQANFQINGERHVGMDGQHINNNGGITGDSMVDEANTWWAAIQSTVCEQGPEFQ